MDGFKLSLAEFEYRYAIAHKALNDWTMISLAPQGPLISLVKAVNYLC